MRVFAISLVAILVGGCHGGAPLDENDASHAQVLRKNLHGASESANQQVATGEISRSEAERITREKAAELAKKVPPDDIEGPDSWKYGEMFLAAHDWVRAERALRYAVAHAPNEDRRVNDTLRLAQVEAELGRVPEAIKLARSTFDTRPEDKAPILPAIYFKIVPAAEAKSHDKELADLLEDGTVQHERVRVDPTSGGGRRFLIAKRKHLHNAHIKAAELYEATGHPAEAAASRAKAGNDPASTA